MPFGYIWTCDQCKHSIITAGIFTFYIDKKGNRIRCAHPIPSEAEKNITKIGATRDAYCPHCKQIRDVTVMVFANPKKKFPAICDVCHTKLIENLEGVSCPKCEGHFRETGRWMS